MSRRKRMMEGLDQDIRDYIERGSQDNVDRGMPPEEAHYAALRKFGNVAGVKEETWEVWSFMWIEQLWQDEGHGLRQLRRNPGFTVVAVITLALGIGANTAVFGLINAVLFKPLPVIAGQELVDVYGFKDDESFAGGAMSYPDYRNFRDQTKSLTGLAAVTAPQLLAVDREGESQLDPAQLVISNYFDVLGVKPFLGSTFEAARDRVRGDDPVVVLSYTTWQREFASNRQVIGKAIRLSGVLMTIVGVAPRVAHTAKAVDFVGEIASNYRRSDKLEDWPCQEADQVR